MEWLPLFDRYGVDLVVTGHEHHFERTLAVRGVDADSPTLARRLPIHDWTWSTRPAAQCT